MWHLDLAKLRAALGRESLGRVAIETGTCRGGGTRALAKEFARVITMELDPELHARARQRLGQREFSHVSLLCGNSASLLPTVLPELGDASLFFFLDAHWSGDATVDWAQSRWKGYGFDTAHLGIRGVAPSGPEQCPLAEELTAIVAHARGPCVILVDDMKNLPTEGPGVKGKEFAGEDWSHLSRASLRAIVAPRLEREIALEDPAQWLLVLKPAEG